MSTREEVRAELVRSRGFIRGAETQLTKALAALDALEEAPIVEVPPPPATSLEPADFTTIVYRPFNTKAANDSDRGTGPFPTPVGGSEGWDGCESRYPNLMIVGGSMRTIYEASQSPGSAPGTAQTQYLGGPRDLYTRTKLLLGPAYWVGGVANKLFFHKALSGPEVFLALHATGDPDLFTLAANFQGTPDNAAGPAGGWFFASGAPLRRNVLYTLETLLVMGSAPGAKDGVFKCAVNGEVVIDRSDVCYYKAGDDPRWAMYHLNSTLGSAIPNPAGFFMDIDDVYVSGRMAA